MSSQLAAARAADVERAVQRANLLAQSRNSPAPAAARTRRRPVSARRAVVHWVGELLIATGSRLAGPEPDRRHLRRV